MKKRLAVVLAAIMMLSCTTVLANPSIDTNVDVVGAVTADGTRIDLEVDQTAPTLEANKVAAVEKAEAMNGDVVAMVEIVVPNGGSISNANLTVTVSVASAQLGETYKALHFTGTEWLTHDAKVNVAGQVTIYNIESLSPFYIVKVAPAAPAPQPEVEEESVLPPYNPNVWPWNEIIAREEAAKAAQNAATDATLPKTGAVAVLPFAAMACLAGAVVCGRKEK